MMTIQEEQDTSPEGQMGLFQWYRLMRALASLKLMISNEVQLVECATCMFICIYIYIHINIYICRM